MTEEAKFTEEEILEIAINEVSAKLMKDVDKKLEKVEKKKEKGAEITSKEAWGALFNNAGRDCKKAGKASGGYFSRIGKAFAGR